ncbi:MAG: N-acetylmuramoyl-L-alanine amidase [Lachnospiraceae bacterium]
MDERQRRRRKRRMRVYWMRALTVVCALGILTLLFLAGRGIWRLLRGDKQETMAVSHEEQELLDELKEQMNGKEFVLILDAGHGGNDVGTGDPDYYEKDINMDIVGNMKEMLEYCGVDVMLTRDGDETVALEERSAQANESGADWFVSIHCNYCEEDASVAGLECYYWSDSVSGKAFAEKIVQSAEDSGQIAVRGIKTEDFHVLRETSIPAVLVETGYISNREDRKNLYDADYQKTLSVYLVRGIIEGYLQWTETVSD